ncbi:hypothetical protein Esi_0155_0068 [Ectocarpus siliculosus]|uniref:Cyclic nucleotide-binding domain-containing protein n=1 Tax=Ectocarpus siliculosus TaxID=2880 RepID=D8LG26_ECTSI|nr:hypothetical protein Esi_0155_0068 [Ectocarpus siliculosus]|eukprot:CBN78925.1 hypothetical protein Esi_0155_0068 [Ectocarpus siliculosus]
MHVDRTLHSLARLTWSRVLTREFGTTLLDEEAAIGGIGGAAPKGGAELAQSAMVPVPNHDVSVMPTVVEGRQGAGIRAAEAVEAVAETKTELEGAAMSKDLPNGSVVESLFSSIRFRGGTADAPPSPSPYPSSSGGANAAKGGSMRGSLTDESSGRGSMLAMFRKASHSFSSNSAMSRSHRGHHQRNTSDLQGLQRRMPARGKLTEADEAMLSDSEADYDAFDNNSERVDKKLFSPNFRFLRWYATFMLVALLTFVFYNPIRIAFFPSERGAWYGIDLVWHLVFAIDVLVHLNTGFVDGTDGKVVYSRMAICRRYAKHALIVDLLAAFPFTFIPGLGPGSADGNHEIAYLLSLPKMFQVYWLMTMVYENHRLHEGTFLAVRTLLSVVVTAHLFGCGWYMLATLLSTECEDLYFEGLPEGEFVFANGLEYTAGDYIASECPWIYRNDYVALSMGRRYLGSVYWALTTLTTVGYGDLSARTPPEQIYSMAVQIVGVSWYGYIVGTWASILNSFDRKDKEQRSKMREVVAFSKAAGLPPEMAKKVRQHFRFALYRQDNWITFNEQELVSDMPAGLRADVITYVHANLIAQIPWLEGKDKNFVADVVIVLKPRLFMAGDVLYSRGSQPEEMFFIASGLVMLKYKQERVGFLRHGQMAGLIGLASSEKHRITAVVAQKDAHCHGLSRANFTMLVESYPKEMEELREAAKSLRNVGG